MAEETFRQRATFLGGGELAEGSVLDNGFGERVLLARLRAAEVIACDLEAVEKEPATLQLNGVIGDATEDLGDGELDRGPVVEAVEAGEVEAGTRLASAHVGEHRGAMRVVVVAEMLLAQGRGAATTPIGEDVAAEEGLARLTLRFRVCWRIDFEDVFADGQFDGFHDGFSFWVK
jgi:hypothetical protein